MRSTRLNEEMSIAVLMTCHNRMETTLSCLRRLVPQLSPGDDVFLVDDGSTDGTGARVRAEFPTIHVIDADGSLYWAKGMRLAWEVAEKSGTYDFYLWLNDDVELYEKSMVSVFEDWKSIGDNTAVLVGACGCDGKCTYGATDSSDRKIVPNGGLQLASGWLNGNFVLVPSAAYKKVGKISSDYSHARADYDYAERLKLADIPFYVTSKYVGACPFDFYGKISGKNLAERISWLWKPGYFNLKDLYLIRSRYHGKLKAVISCLKLIQIVVTGVR